MPKSLCCQAFLPCIALINCQILIIVREKDNGQNDICAHMSVLLSPTVRTLRTLGFPSKPDFLIIGAQKAGTTGLYSILRQHSKLVGSLKKEVQYFNRDEFYLNKPLSQYHSFFPSKLSLQKDQLVYEATPDYIFHHKVAERIYRYNPNIKMIAVFRDPALRCFSGWTMYHHNFRPDNAWSRLHEPRSFRECIEAEIKDIDAIDYYSFHKAYVKRGLYAEQLERYLKYFKREQFLFLEQKEIKNDLEGTTRKVCDFLGVPFESLSLKIENTGKVNSIDQYPKEIAELKEFYAPHNEKLFELIGTRYNWD